MKQTLIIVSVLSLLFSCNQPKEKEEQIKIGQTQTQSNTSSGSQSELEKSMERGGLVYTDFCMQCHLANGKGVPGAFPPLAGSDWLKDKRTESIHSVKFGQQGEIEVNGVKYNGVMVPMGLSDEEIADVMNYVMNSWGNTQEKIVTPEEVAAVEK